MPPGVLSAGGPQSGWEEGLCAITGGASLQDTGVEGALSLWPLNPCTNSYAFLVIMSALLSSFYG